MHYVFLMMLSLMAAAAQAVEPVKIGVSLSLTGKYAELGRMSQNAYKLWETDINRQNGLLGRPVRVMVVDDKSDAQIAKEIYRRLIEEDKVDLIFGPYSSEITQAVLPITDKHRSPMLVAGAAADKLWQQNSRYIFGVYVGAKRYAVSFLELLASSDINTVALVSADEIFSKDVADGTKVWAGRFGLNVVHSEVFKTGDSNLDEALLRAKKSGAQALMVCGHFDESINAQLALKRIGWHPRAVYSTVGPVLQKYRDVLKADSEYVFAPSQWEPSVPFPGAKDFAAKYQQSFNVMPSYHAANAYAVGQILEAAVNKAASLDREKIRNVLSSLDAMTIIGRYGVDGAGKQVRHFALTVQLQNGKKEIVAPKELMTAKPIWK
ncbi:amino acid ABC transporter substrate-binding protein [Pseudoduganella namucuonensis]|uniref:Amino acid/amide ABC transporter substrate-binding protein, HAAT family n=1 Tax=Pseudoduganella namucuonensis TaxID=1035707 RepID=A0A1I7FL64_9BURK|nr:amino acid ABC transporter substrate-binding protein [Pseudoduganella namucuonensis]SFU36776.1 amino acid/amide ABC transporter substrate-binding protein, HAAT family [Pseudoduganella namucuonensis]